MASMKIYRVTLLLGAVLSVCSVEGFSNSSRVAAISSKSDTNTRTSIVCPSSHSCQGRCRMTKEWDTALKEEFINPHCHCDPFCDKYQDCCADYRKFCGNQTSSSDVPLSACRRLNEKEPSVWIIESCPSSYKNRDVRNKCISNEKLRADRLEEMIPVIYVESGLLYKNRYCAICNGAIPDFGFFPVKIRIRCNISPPEGLNSTQAVDYMLEYCTNINFELGKKAKRRFCFPTENTCPTGASREDEEECKHGPSGVLFSTIKSQRNFRNVHCLACHGIDPKDASCGPQETPKGLFTPKSFEVVMKFVNVDFSTFEMTKPKKTITCDQGFAYDKHLELCRRAILQDGPTKSIKDKYRIMMWLSPLDDKLPQTFSHTDFVDVLTKQFVGLLSSQIEVNSIKVEDRTICAVFDLHARYTNNKNSNSSGGMQLDALINFTNNFKMEVAQRMWLVFKVTTRRLSCAQREVYPTGKFYIYPHTKNMDVNNSNGEKMSYSYKQYYLIGVNYTTTDDLKYAGATAIVCRSFFGFQCNHVLLAVKDEEYVMFTNKSLLFKPTGQQYAEGEYDMVNNIPWICTNYSVTFTSNNTGSNTNKTNKTLVKRKLLPGSIHTNIRRYMTIVGFTISILSLFLVLLAHGILRDLREPLPGKNLISLSVSLFLAQFWYLLGSGDTDKPLFCHITACILHYLFLATFGCTFIVAYDTRRTFSATTAKAHALGTSHQTKRLTAYLLISWGIPLVVVVTCALLDWLDVVTIGYRNEDACWIGNETALLIVFAAPIGSVLVYNVLAFTQTIYAINSARKQTQRVKSSHYARPATVKIYIRLISLMGFSWFFGISAPLIHHGLMYPFVFFTTLQGLYIFLAFICKARVLRMLKAKIPLNKGKRVRRPTKGATTTTGSLTSTPYSKYPPPRDETQI